MSDLAIWFFGCIAFVGGVGCGIILALAYRRRRS